VYGSEVIAVLNTLAITLICFLYKQLTE